jgi:hypothetical protein
MDAFFLRSGEEYSRNNAACGIGHKRALALIQLGRWMSSPVRRTLSQHLAWTYLRVHNMTASQATASYSGLVMKAYTHFTPLTKPPFAWTDGRALELWCTCVLIGHHSIRRRGHGSCAAIEDKTSEKGFGMRRVKTKSLPAMLWMCRMVIRGIRGWVWLNRGNRAWTSRKVFG